MQLALHQITLHLGQHMALIVPSEKRSLITTVKNDQTMTLPVGCFPERCFDSHKDKEYRCIVFYMDAGSESIAVRQNVTDPVHS
jgi:hypothetical protein